MSMLATLKLRLPSYFYVRALPPDESGVEVLHVVSERRQIRLKGHSFREFRSRVVPLLDGTRTVGEISSQVAAVFSTKDLEDALEVMLDNQIVEVVSGEAESATDLEPQLNFFREVGPHGIAAQDRLKQAKVVVLGLSGPGAYVAEALAAAGVGRLVCADALPVTAADVYLSPSFATEDIGKNRSPGSRRSCDRRNPRATVEANSDRS